MTVPEAVDALRRIGGIRLVDGNRLQVRLPRPLPPALEVAVSTLRSHKPEVVALLKGSQWPAESHASQTRFGVPSAKLYPLLGHLVLTPEGVGRLLQVFDDRVRVLFKGETKTREFRPEEIAISAD